MTMTRFLFMNCPPTERRQASVVYHSDFFVFQFLFCNEARQICHIESSHKLLEADVNHATISRPFFTSPFIPRLHLGRGPYSLCPAWYKPTSWLQKSLFNSDCNTDVPVLFLDRRVEVYNCWICLLMYANMIGILTSGDWCVYCRPFSVSAKRHSQYYNMLPALAM